MEHLKKILQEKQTFSLIVPQFENNDNSITLIETHLSFVCLVDKFAIKLKKPIDLGPPFPDQTDVNVRKKLCELELVKNMEWNTNGMYLRVLPLCKSKEGIHRFFSSSDDLESEIDETIDWAILMKRFPQNRRLDKFLDDSRGSVEPNYFKEFGQKLARLQMKSKAQKENIDNYMESMKKLIFVNLDQLKETSQGIVNNESLLVIESWFEKQYEMLKKVLEKRLNSGFVRQLHADLHTSNLFLDENSTIQAYDCLEFNQELSRIDTASDVAFLFMDLYRLNRKELAWIFLNSWLEETGDYQAIELLSFFTVHRAMVRCKTSCLSLKSNIPNYCDELTLELIKKYISLSMEIVQNSKFAVLAMCGLSASGKSFLSEKLFPRLFGFRIRSDLERKRVYNEKYSVTEEALTGRKRVKLYDEVMTTETYGRLFSAVKSAFIGKQLVILDAAFLDREKRNKLTSVIRDLTGDMLATNILLFLHCTAKDKNLKSRILERSTSKKDISDADLKVLEAQIFEDFSHGETFFEIITDEHEDDEEYVSTVINRIDQYFSSQSKL